MNERVIEFIVGGVLISISLVGRRFSWGGFGASRRADAKAAPVWMGKLLFFIGGLWFIYIGLKGK